MVYGLDRDPVWSPLKDKDFTGLFGNLWDKLKGTGTRADDRNPFVGQIVSMFPSCRMERDAVKRLTPFNIREV